MNEFFWTQNSTLPRLEVIVSGNGGPVDLTNSTGNIFLYRPRYTGTVSILSGQFASKASGDIYVDLTGTTITNTIGPYLARFLIYFPNGGVQPYPSDGYINFEIISGLI